MGSSMGSFMELPNLNGREEYLLKIKFALESRDPDEMARALSIACDDSSCGSQGCAGSAIFDAVNLAVELDRQKVKTKETDHDQDAGWGDDF